MLHLGPHASFIIAAYGVTFVAVGALVLATLEDDRKQRRKLAELERLGIRRRSAKAPASPTVKSRAAKPKPTRAAAKRKAATPRTGKTRS
jgi:heme exporter protein D